MSEAWPPGRVPTEIGDYQPEPDMAAMAMSAEPMAAPGTYPVPPGRGQWRVLVLERAFAGGRTWGDLAIAELNDARSRRLERKWNTAATFSFTVDGHSPAASFITELTTDILALRWNDAWNLDEPMFHGLVTHSQDTITEQQHTVTFTCHDYSSMLWRRILTGATTTTWLQYDQDEIVIALVNKATAAVSSGGVSFSPGSFLPLKVALSQPNGASRAFSGNVRDRTYASNTNIGQAIDDLAKVQNGFDYDTAPFGSAINVSGDADGLRIFYPYQGTAKTNPALIYGSNVLSLTRTVNSGDYANFVRVLGNTGSNPTQLFGEAWNSDANNVTQYPVGLWMNDENAADVTIQSSLTEKARGDLAMQGILVPTYSLALRPGAWSSIVSSGSPGINMAIGDVLPLVIQSGRLNVNTTIRILGINFVIGDDGQEDVELTVGRPETTLSGLWRAPVRDTAALTRR